MPQHCAPLSWRAQQLSFRLGIGGGPMAEHSLCPEPVLTPLDFNRVNRRPCCAHGRRLVSSDPAF